MVFLRCGLRDWLVEPSPGHRYACSLSMKKTLLIVGCFVLLLSLGVVEYLFIDKFSIMVPRLAHAILFLVELLCFLLFIAGVYPEKTRLVLPFGLSQIARSLLVAVLVVYYIVLMFSYESIGYLAKTTGHLVFVLVAHIFLVYLVWETYQVLLSRGSSSYSSAPRDILNTGHHVIVLEQPIEEAMYGKRSNSQFEESVHV